MALKQSTLSALWSKPTPSEQLLVSGASPAGGSQPKGLQNKDGADQGIDAAHNDDITIQEASKNETSSGAPLSTNKSLDGPSQAPFSSNTTSLHPCATVQPLQQHTLPAFRRLIRTLLPVRYPDKTFAQILENPNGTSIPRVIVWRNAKGPTALLTAPHQDASLHTETQPLFQNKAPAGACSSETMRGVVVAAICARIQAVLTSGPDPTPTGTTEVYVQMLGVLAPYRGLGLASALLDEVIKTAANEHGAREVLAHVWEANEDALQWYVRRGFCVDEGLVVDYYQRLQPRGARIVRKRIRVGDLL